MHIPQHKTTEIDVLSFEDALIGGENKDYDTEKWLYVPDFYSEYRYILGTKGKKPLICIGINPSTARPDCLDNTLKSVERIAKANGFDSFLMFNVYAQRATRPEDMEKECNVFLHSENLKAFEYILSHCHEKPAVWAAWGKIINTRHYLSECVGDFLKIGKKYDAEWFTAGQRSKDGGHPHHPLYLKQDSLLEKFDVEEYINRMLNKKSTVG